MDGYEGASRIEGGPGPGQYVIFDLGGDLFGIDVMKSQEVVEIDRIRPLPDTRDYMAGVIDLRGRIVPVIDLKKRIGMEGTGQAGPAIIILEVHGELVGVIVDAVVDVTGIAPSEIQRAPHFTVRTESDTVAGIGRVDDRMVVIMEAEKILTEAEMRGMPGAG